MAGDFEQFVDGEGRAEVVLNGFKSKAFAAHEYLQPINQMALRLIDSRFLQLEHLKAFAINYDQARIQILNAIFRFNTFDGKALRLINLKIQGLIETHVIF